MECPFITSDYPPLSFACSQHSDMWKHPGLAVDHPLALYSLHAMRNAKQVRLLA